MIFHLAHGCRFSYALPRHAAAVFFIGDQEDDEEDDLFQRGAACVIAQPETSSSPLDQGVFVSCTTMQQSEPTNGLEALQRADTYVTKIGGDNAGRLRSNALRSQQRVEQGVRQVLALSAIRSSHPSHSAFAAPGVADQDSDGQVKPGFNTTSHLIAIARLLELGDTASDARSLQILDRVASFTRAVVSAEIDRDPQLQGCRASLRADCDAVLGQLLSDDREQGSLASSIRHRDARVVRKGQDWILEADRRLSVTGLGEAVAEKLYHAYFTARGIRAESLRLEPEFSEALAAPPGSDTKEQITRLRARAALEIAGIFARSDVAIAGGYLPLLAGERGYSDKTGALYAQAVADAGRKPVYLIEKSFPVMSGNPLKVRGAQVVRRMTHFLARELFGNTRGANGGAVHPEALDLLSKDDIDIVVLNPQMPLAAEAMTLIHHFEPQPNGVEIVASKRIPLALQISSAEMIRQPGFEAAVAKWLGDRGLSIQHIATSEGTLSYTFYEGDWSEDTLSSLRDFLRERFGVDDPAAVETLRDVSVIYCLGNNMKRPGQASKATEALEFAGVDIHFITQGINESVMTFLVDADAASRAVQMLHDLLITLPSEQYDALKGQFREQMLQLIGQRKVT
ncbi:MAG: hypothetical protein Greene041619_678 [Candidatus Peregrinibacteria bacterium Greene0416_19]|nr:MAG: hypothetical protein Greene041619_678 [Candidatus Peregrinibacteria bacterium Greene0416_19]